MIDFLKKQIIWVILICSFLIILSFVAGLTIKNWPIIKLDTEFKISEVVNIGITILLAFFIPFLINHFIEKGNKVNEMVLNEVCRYRDHLESIHSRVHLIYQTNKLTEINKTELNVLCEILDAKFEILKIVLLKRCKTNATLLIDSLMHKQVKYWRVLTSIEINSLEVNSINSTTLRNEIKFYQEITEDIMNINLLVTEH